MFWMKSWQFIFFFLELTNISNVTSMSTVWSSIIYVKRLNKVYSRSIFLANASSKPARLFQSIWFAWKWRWYIYIIRVVSWILCRRSIRRKPQWIGDCANTEPVPRFLRKTHRLQSCCCYSPGCCWHSANFNRKKRRRRKVYCFEKEIF